MRLRKAAGSGPPAHHSKGSDVALIGLLLKLYPGVDKNRGFMGQRRVSCVITH